jgi:hypothetical protein
MFLFLFKDLINKKAITPVIALSLLLAVSVISVITFSDWFSLFSSKIIIDYELESKYDKSKLEFIYFNKNELFIKNSESINIEVSRININGNDCFFSGNYSSDLKLNLTFCLNEIEYDVMNIEVYTNIGILSKTMYLENYIVNIAELCTDSIDNDGDGLVDCSDSECFWENSCSTTIVDFGNPHIFGLDNWTNVIEDLYTNYVELEDGMSITIGSNKDYDYQGVAGTSSFLFQENDSIRVTWYNANIWPRTFTPKISFIDSNRPDNLWYLMDEITVLPDQTNFSKFTFNSTTFGTYSLVNVNVNYENNQILFARSINLFSNSNTPD